MNSGSRSNKSKSIRGLLAFAALLPSMRKGYAFPEVQFVGEATPPEAQPQKTMGTAGKARPFRTEGG